MQKDINQKNKVGMPMKLKDYGRNHSGLLLAGVDVSKAKGALSIFDLLQQGLSMELMYHLCD